MDLGVHFDYTVNEEIVLPIDDICSEFECDTCPWMSRALLSIVLAGSLFVGTSCCLRVCASLPESLQDDETHETMEIVNRLFNNV